MQCLFTIMCDWLYYLVVHLLVKLVVRMWSSQVCTIVTCPTYSLPSNGASSNCTIGSPTTYATACSLVCATGYTSSGSTTCRSTGTYSGQSCTIVSCPTYSLPPNGISSSCATTTQTYGTSCSLTCATGYTSSGSSICLANGTYSGQSCTIVSCPTYALPSNGATSNCSIGVSTTYATACSAIMCDWLFT